MERNHNSARKDLSRNPRGKRRKIHLRMIAKREPVALSLTTPSLRRTPGSNLRLPLKDAAASLQRGSVLSPLLFFDDNNGRPPRWALRPRMQVSDRPVTSADPACRRYRPLERVPIAAAISKKRRQRVRPYAQLHPPQNLPLTRPGSRHADFPEKLRRGNPAPSGKPAAHPRIRYPPTAILCCECPLSGTCRAASGDRIRTHEL